MPLLTPGPRNQPWYHDINHFVETLFAALTEIDILYAAGDIIGFVFRN